MASRALKPWRLTEEETFASFTSWQQHIIYVLNQDATNPPFFLTTSPDSKWTKVSPTSPHRGLVDDAEDNGLKKEVKLLNLNTMLGFIAQFVPHYLSADITEGSTSVTSIWQIIRQYYGFHQSEAQFLKLVNIKWEGPDQERPERLYRRILAHFHDNLLKEGSKLKHNEETPTSNEVLSPTVERIAVLRWMELIHPKLPALVAIKFGHDLQRMTLKDLQPQIADALDGLLEELNREDEAVEVHAAWVYNRSTQRPCRTTTQRFSHHNRQSRQNTTQFHASRSQCRICRAENRPYYGHTMATCTYISSAERQDIVQSFRVQGENQCDDVDNVQQQMEQSEFFYDESA